MPDPTAKEQVKARRAVGECSSHAVAVERCKVCATLSAQATQVSAAFAELREEIYEECKDVVTLRGGTLPWNRHDSNLCDEIVEMIDRAAALRRGEEDDDGN